jgi:Acyl-CoA thioesterase C-terminal domain
MIGPEIVPLRCPLPGPFAAATAVRPAAAGQWSAAIDPGWVIAGNANGGYLLAVATRALASTTGRLPGAEHVDSLALLCAVDAFPPTAFNARLPVAGTPTVELTAHIRANPAPGWLRCRFSTRFVTAGFLEEDGEVWDSTGRLVGQSRQLALVPGTDTPAVRSSVGHRS